MSNKLIIAVGKLGKLIDEESVIQTITQWNKNKVYPATPIVIDISDNKITDNSDEIHKIIDDIREWADEIVKNSLDLKEVEDAKKTVLEISKFIIGTRKEATNPLKDIASKYSSKEAVFKEINTDFTLKIDAIKEKSYKANEILIREYMTTYIAEIDESLSLVMFEDFIDNKRKNLIATSRGELKKNIKEDIEEVVKIAYEPIKAQKELNEKQTRQSKQLSAYLDNIPTEAENHVLEAYIIAFEQMKSETVGELYPDIKEEADRRIDEQIAQCRYNIKTNTDAEGRNADARPLERLEQVREQLNGISLTKDELKSIHATLSALFREMKLEENKNKVKTLGLLVNGRLAALDKADTEKLDTQGMLSEWKIDMNDLVVMAMQTVKASTEEEAILEFVDKFKEHLSMVGLTQK